MPSVVSDSIVERENCILFTQCLQYATFPLYSLQLTTRSTCTDTQKPAKPHRTDACSDECERFFSVTSCPDMSSGAELGMNPTFSCGIKQEAYSLFSFTLKLVTSVRQEEKKKGNKIHKCVHLSTYCNPNTHVPTGEDQTAMQMCTSQRE